LFQKTDTSSFTILSPFSLKNNHIDGVFIGSISLISIHFLQAVTREDSIQANQIMGLVHTPRVLLTLAQAMRQPSNKLIGITEPHVYYGRAGLFDVDYLGHLNNAAYLNHSEYARWSMSAVNGWLQAGYQHGSHFVLTSASCRYRAEIRPVFRKFKIETMITGMDDKHMWM
jgi:hypothetical protein